MNTFSSPPFNNYKVGEFPMNDSIEFWDQVATKNITWDKKYKTVYKENGIYPGNWFIGGMINTCFNLLDINIKDELKKDKIAIIYECPYLNETIKITYYQLYERVCEFSRVLLNLNISKDDLVLIHMPNSIETIIAMLSCNRIGATHCVLLECLNEKNVANKINIICPKLIITSNYGIVNDQILPFTSILMKALELSIHKPDSIITLNRVLHKGDDNQLITISNIPIIPNSLDWNDQVLQCKSNPFYEYIPVDSNHPVYILFTSGTTGNSKPVVRNNGPNLVNVKYTSTDTEPIVYFSFTFMGWASFHTILYETLISGDTLVIYEGSITFKPSNVLNDLWSIIERNKVTHSFISPILAKMSIKLDPEAIQIKKYDLSSLKLILIGGDIVEKYVLDYILYKLNVNVLNGYSQTEFGVKLIDSILNYSKCSHTLLKSQSFVNISILSIKGKEMDLNETGELAFKLPLPPCFASTFYKDNDTYKSKFEKHIGYYCTGDSAYKTENGLFGMCSRIDDVIKINGIQTELDKIEQSINKHPLIFECCCVPIESINEGNIPIGILILNQNVTSSSSSITPLSNNELNQLKLEINSIITKDFNSNVNLRNIIIVNRIPKTKTGKVVRSMISNVLNDHQFQIPNTFDEIDSLIEIKNCFNNKSI